MKTWAKVLIIIGSIITTIVIAVCVILFLNSDRFEEIKVLSKEHLTKYEYSSGGDMRGSSESQQISIYDDKYALVSNLSCEYYADDGVVTEYLVDKNVLSEIETIFRKYHMDRWAHKTISNIFVADGASYSYIFRFGDLSIHFSSQVYPISYKNHLAEIDDVIKKYSEEKIELPTLVREKLDEEETYDNYIVKEGEISFSVFRYINGDLYCRLKNGTNKEIEFNTDFKLTKIDTNEEIKIDSASEYNNTVGEMRSEEKTIKLINRLEKGKYKLESGKYGTEFEIK